MKRAYVAPTAHTYKLLMDADGSIEPVDIDGTSFCASQAPSLSKASTLHFVCKDLDKAISIFESIPSHLRDQSADADVYGAMINAFVAHKRTDLVPE
ncbi:hypothetical protein APHAL10511_003517 [Amanita phalloides]|nr:hypothetical protein APHAL10511_003517 [Amanita phalloides]